MGQSPSFFIRPTEDRKIFAGQIVTKGEFDVWVTNTLNAHKDGYTTLTPDTEVIVSEVKNIHSEWRFFVVDGKIVTGSLIKGMVYYIKSLCYTVMPCCLMHRKWWISGNLTEHL